MVFEEVASSLGPDFAESFNSIATILQIIGGIFGIYVIFWAINLFINFRKNKTLKNILKNTEEINAKLGKLLKK
ncbi:MAG: hypothetical protein WC533_04705 [Candidatus Pacearchaeota archaeon]